MYDSFTTAINTQRATTHWMETLTDNMMNQYTPGFRESKITFSTFLGGAINDNPLKNQGQGKSTPFTFDSEGVYRAKNGDAVQGYILNDNGEIMAGTKSISADLYEETALKGGALSIPTTNIKMWIDPNNGKFMGKYDEYEIKEDGTIYGKADGGKRSVPLYKIATANFHNPSGLYEVKEGVFVETDDSGKPVIGRGSIRSGLLEQANTDFKGNMTNYQQAKVQMELVNALIKSNKELLEEAMRLVSS